MMRPQQKNDLKKRSTGEVESAIQEKLLVLEETRKEQQRRVNEQMIERSQMRKKMWIKEVQNNPQFGESRFIVETYD